MENKLVDQIHKKNSGPINILFIEDSPDDYELIKRQIVREGYSLNPIRVETREEFEAALNSAAAWDVVISDNSLPAFDATSALKITRAKFPFLPFIIVSGTIGQDVAVAAMRAGANDYLLKNDLTRLVPAIERELYDVKLRKAKHVAEEALKKSEERYRLLAENIQDLVCLHNPDLTYSWLSPSVNKILGYEPQELLGMNQFSLMHPDDSAAFNNFTEAISDSPVRLSYRLKEKEGTYIYVEAVFQAIYESGELVRLVSTTRDITEQRVNEEKAINMAKELTTLIDTANAPIFGIDWNGRINEWNQVTAKITGYTKEEVIGKSLVDEFILDGFKISVTELLKKALRGTDVTRYELPIYTRKGKVVTILFNATARRNLDSKIVGVISVGQDITELIEYRERLEMKVAERTRKLHEALVNEKELVALKSKFVSMASHEFRTPLATINFATNYIRRYKSKLQSGEIEQKLDKIEEQIKHMTYLLDDVLLIGKTESGKIVLHPTLIGLSEFSNKIVEEVAYSTKNSHKILCTIATEKKEIYIDEKLLRNILINLLTNAIKFSPGESKVLLDVKCSGECLTLSVEDWGMGIEDEDLEKIFDAFHRTGNVGAIQGTGLGLTIVKKAVELQKGIIEVNSIVDKGTTVKIQIPLMNEEHISRR